MNEVDMTLLECFCQAEPMITEGQNKRGLTRYGIKCGNCGRSYVGGLSQENAISSWNRNLKIDRRTYGINEVTQG